jgi:hypothetical protein
VHSPLVASMMRADPGLHYGWRLGHHGNTVVRLGPGSRVTSSVRRPARRPAHARKMKRQIMAKTARATPTLYGMTDPLLDSAQFSMCLPRPG